MSAPSHVSWVDSPRLPTLLGVCTAIAVWVVWSGSGGLPVMHDEWAYWLQAGQYASGRWSAPAPAIPEFFEQLYVLVTPVFASKYPPGHAMLLAPGFLLGWPMLMPLLVSGVTGALVFALARRCAGSGVALVTWLVWVGTFGNLRFRASYFSETTSALCWLVVWWALLEWRASGGRRWMVTLAAAVGVCAITRPYTAVALALPVAVVVLRDLVRGASWRDLGVGVLVGSAIVAVLPVWNRGTMGEWRTTPLAAYTAQYLPFDVPGFGVDDTAPSRRVPGEIERTRVFLREIKVEQATAPMWRTIGERIRMLGLDAFGGWRLPLVIAFAFGVASVGTSGLFALGTSLLLVLAYAAQAHTADWTVYYLETFPAVAFVAAAGVKRLLGARTEGPAAQRWAPVVVLLVSVLLARDVVVARSLVARVSEVTRRFRAGVAALPKRPNLVFVEYASRRSMHLALVANEGDLDRAVTWVVHERGDDDRRLMARAPTRTAYRFDEASGRFTEIAR